jgi:hypothetical protein
MDDGDPRREIERLEFRIETLAARIENCAKFILAAQIAMVVGGIVLLALFFGVIRFDPAWMAGASAALLGGIVVFGSNDSTAKEARSEMAAAEAERALLIGRIELRVIPGGPTLH